MDIMPIMGTLNSCIIVCVICSQELHNASVYRWCPWKTLLYICMDIFLQSNSVKLRYPVCFRKVKNKIHTFGKALFLVYPWQAVHYTVPDLKSKKNYPEKIRFSKDSSNMFLIF